MFCELKICPYSSKIDTQLDEYKRDMIISQRSVKYNLTVKQVQTETALSSRNMDAGALSSNRIKLIKKTDSQNQKMVKIPVTQQWCDRGVEWYKMLRMTLIQKWHFFLNTHYF